MPKPARFAQFLLAVGCWFVLLIVVGSLLHFEPSDRQEVPMRKTVPSAPQRPAQTAWQVALKSGDGTDWLALSDRDQTVLCLEAAKALKQDQQIAIEYEVFLHTFYSEPNPTTRSKRIAETLAVCQTLIEQGLIKVDR